MTQISADTKTPITNRRNTRRVSVEKPCKIQDLKTGRYFSGRTVDLSQDGILVRLHQATNFKPGDAVKIGVAMHDRQGLIQAKELIDSTVVRMLHTEDGATTIAVQFDAAAEQIERATTQAMRKAA